MKVCWFVAWGWRKASVRRHSAVGARARPKAEGSGKRSREVWKNPILGRLRAPPSHPFLPLFLQVLSSNSTTTLEATSLHMWTTTSPWSATQSSPTVENWVKPTKNSTLSLAGSISTSSQSRQRPCTSTPSDELPAITTGRPPELGLHQTLSSNPPTPCAG